MYSIPNLEVGLKKIILSVILIFTTYRVAKYFFVNFFQFQKNNCLVHFQYKLNLRSKTVYIKSILNMFFNEKIIMSQLFFCFYDRFLVPH